MLRRLRAFWRGARGIPGLRGLIAATDRLWWAHVIRQADVVDLELVAAQNGPRTTRGAIRAYVRGGFRSGMALNPLLMEQLVSQQLSDAHRVPALYAYLVNHVATIETSVNWDARAYVADHPDALSEPGGPVGHAWRSARASGSLPWGSPARTTDWESIRDAAVRGAIMARSGFLSAPGLRLDAAAVVLCRLGATESDIARALTTSIETARRLSATLVVSIATRRADAWVQAAELTTWIPDTVVIADDSSTVAALEGSMTGGTLLVVRGPGADIASDDLVRLAEAGRHGASAPLWLAPDGTIASAGRIRHHGETHRLLHGHPPEDARGLGATVTVDAIDGETWARPAGARGAVSRTLLDVTVRAPLSPIEAVPVDGRPDTDVEALLRPSGLGIERWSHSGPVLVRQPRAVELGDGSTVPSLRWALKIVAPPGRPGEAWGDTHFARGIAAALRRLGQEVVIDAYDARGRATGYLDDVVLALRGPEPFEPQKGAHSILWIISHPDEIGESDIEGFDTVFAGSRSWASAAATRFGRPILPLLQCTDAHRFRPEGGARSRRLLFVGTARGIPRPSVIEPILAGIPVAVYGPDWRGWIPGEAIAGLGIPNDRLPAAYEHAGAVLNDHWPAMRDAGFVSNRLYDVVAAGGRAISDEVDGIHDVFGPAVWTYAAVPDLIEGLRGDLDALFPTEEELTAISSRIRLEHSFDARARTLLDSVLAS